MDLFDSATHRLEKDQSKIRGRARGQGAVISEKAKREAARRKKEQEKLREERDRKKRQYEHTMQYFTSCERGLGVRALAKEGLKLQATSIHGDGDKITLPPSVLEKLTAGGDLIDGSSPWTFRIGLLNPKYTFPSSNALIDMMVPDEHDDGMDDSLTDDLLDSTGPYLEELSHKYISYSHGSVVEFTQEEGHIGLPNSIASALLQSSSGIDIPRIRTKDPAGGDHSTNMETDEEEHTPGHLFWGGFDLPDMLLEVSLVKLPKGRKCMLVPTRDAILNGFYDLKDVKLVLESSFMRTRATLSLNDTVHTWHRGVKYDLLVTEVTPAAYGAVSCINTDIEVDLGANENVEKEMHEAKLASVMSSQLFPPISEDNAGMQGTGFKLSDATVTQQPTEHKYQITHPSSLLPEPPSDQTEGICTVQIKADGKTGRRRLDLKVASLADLFDFAASLIQRDPRSFRLVTRFPRRVLIFSELSLEEAGIRAGQELFLVESV